ncbi:MAG: lysylphosphatidylglycerol synthase transmembrane domain-containing protein [Pseudohongiellaceae bacterium]
MNRRKLFFLTVWLVGCSLVFFTVRELPLAGILERLGEISPLRLVGLLAINSLILFLSVKRWQILAQAFDIQLSLAHLFKVRQAGNTISFVTPGPQFGGEPLQLYWLRQSREIPMDISLAILGADRFMEIFINLSILLLSVIFIFYTDIEVNLSKTFLFIFLTVSILTMLLVLFLRQPEWLENIFKSLFSRFTHTVSNSNESQNASSSWGRILTKIEKNKSKVILAATIALLGWIALLFELLMMMEALGVSSNFYEVIFVMLGIRIALLMPIPGGVGTIEASLFWSFEILGLTLAGAGGLIALSRLRDVIVLFIGIGCLSNLSKLSLQTKA